MTVIIAFFAGVFVATFIVVTSILYAPMASMYFAGGLIGAAVLLLVIFGSRS